MESLLRTVQESGLKSQATNGSDPVTNGLGLENDGQRKHQTLQRQQWAALYEEVG